jgi:hypothetical protein
MSITAGRRSTAVGQAKEAVLITSARLDPPGVNLGSAKTINGRALQISSMDGKVMIDNARVTETDIMASNGIIHVIDSVVLRKRGYFFGGEPRLDVFRLRFFCCYGKSVSVIETCCNKQSRQKCMRTVS